MDRKLASCRTSTILTRVLMFLRVGGRLKSVNELSRGLSKVDGGCLERVDEGFRELAWVAELAFRWRVDERWRPGVTIQ